jgi:hypothetical protein
MHVAVIGAGLTGLATSILLARQGHRVSLLEAMGEAGGLARPLTWQGRTFCPGPQYLWGFEPGGAGERIAALLGLELPMRPIRRDFSRVAVGDGPLVDLVDGVSVDGALSPQGQAFAAALDRLGRASESIAVDAGFCGSDRHMLAAIAKARGLALRDKVEVCRSRDASVRDLARRFGVSARELRLLTSAQLIFAERLDELSAVVFAAARHQARAIAVPVGGVARYVQALIAAVTEVGVALRTHAPVRGVRERGRGFTLETGVVGRFVPDVQRVFESGHSVGCLCILAEIDGSAEATLRDRTLTWFASDDDVDFAPGPGGGGVRAVSLMSPTALAGEPGPAQVLCVYHPSGDSPDSVLQAAQALLSATGRARVLGTLALSPEGWTRGFGAWSGAVYGRRLTAASLQTSVTAALPEGMSLAHSGAGVPGMLACLQMAEAAARLPR